MQKHAPVTSKPAPVEFDFGPYHIADPLEFSRNMLRFMEMGSKVFTGFLERSGGNSPFGATDMIEAAKLFGEISQAWMANPTVLLETNGALLRDLMQLAGATAQRMMGGEALPVAEPEPGDNRFKDPDWSCKSLLRLLEADLSAPHALARRGAGENQWVR